MTEVSPYNKSALPLEEIKEEEEARYGAKETLLDKPLKEVEEEPPLAPEQKKILIAMLLSIGMTQTLYMNIATLLPIEATKLAVSGKIE